MKKKDSLDYKQILLDVYKEAIDKKNYQKRLTKVVLTNMEILGENCYTQKGVYTVFITLLIYKISHPEQDIRKHQTQIRGGFSGRSIDTSFITPTLKEIGLPSMAESGWLTRSLEQPHPYTLDYGGKISNKKVKKAFLELIDAVETKKDKPKFILVELFKKIFEVQKANQIKIKPLENPEKLTISKISDVLNRQFSYHYKTHGGSKLPVLAFYAMYRVIIKEISRYNNCELKELGSHTASDRTSKSAGDIEIYKYNELFEAVEIKLDKPIDSNILRIAKEKIIRYNPKRYYILSHLEIVEEDRAELDEIIEEVKEEHGCQIVINGLIPTLKYYMRLISDLEIFIDLYSKSIENDTELKAIHKTVWNQLLEEL
ncbi:MAG: hypothetical protein KAH48_12645 [Chlorobi bacterium]|nr:hypothetical protein [Chlorobiota bacterium]